MFNQFSANIEYIKWDMNRPLTEVYSKAALDKGIWQTEANHRYVLGVYELQGRIIKEFPYVLLENCASGGGRFDPGMLYYSPQIWCSDNTDALVRMKINSVWYIICLSYKMCWCTYIIGAESYYWKYDKTSHERFCGDVWDVWI